MATKRPALPNTHRVTKRHTNGDVTLYIYAYRGGPLLASYRGSDIKEATRLERASATDLIKKYALQAEKPAPKVMTLHDLIQRYRADQDGLQSLRSSTRKEWERVLGKIDAEFGTLPLKLLKTESARSTFKKWRDGMATTPRKADYFVGVLSRVINYGVQERLVEVNPVVGFKKLHKVDRSEETVSDSELNAVLEHVTEHARRMIILAALTGMRREDFVSLKWDHVQDDRIEFPTSKSNFTQTAVVPLYGEARILIEEMRAIREAQIKEGRVPSSFVLVTEKGTPWKPDSATQAFWRAAKKAGVQKRLHDLRGTAVTRFLKAGLSNNQVAMLVGWSEAKVEVIMRRYVNRREIVAAVTEQLARAEGSR
ncbi:hypothetical protein OB03_11775 [Brevundimonas sp. GN22]